ncbi:hypothetical protein QWA68_014966 [Fusarium oxysporum]|nr:hypothetical protein QWA68_014966 [Fusarium oxysporum]
MDANVPAKRQSPECSASVPSLNNLDAFPDDWKTFPWNKFPGFSISDPLAGRLRGFGSTALTFKPAILPRRGNGFTSIVFGKLSPR